MSYDSKEFKKSLDDYLIGLVPSVHFAPEVKADLSAVDQALLNGLTVRCGIHLLVDHIRTWFASNRIPATVDGWTSTSTPTLGLVRWTYHIGEDKHEDSYVVDGRFWLSRE